MEYSLYNLLWHFSDELSEGRPIDHPSPHGLGDLFAELILVGSHELCCLMVEGIVGVGLNEEEDQPQDHSVHAKHGLPVCTQDIQTHIALHVNIWMVNLRLTVAFRRFMRVVFGDNDSKLILPAHPIALPFFQVNENLEFHDLILVWEIDRGMDG